MDEQKFITKDSGNHMEFETGMKRDISDNKPRFDLLHPECVPYEHQMMTRFAELLARGAKKYSERNREKAETQQELNRFKESAYRHFLQRFHNEIDEDHAVATRFNIMGAEMVKYKLQEKENKKRATDVLFSNGKN